MKKLSENQKEFVKTLVMLISIVLIFFTLNHTMFLLTNTPSESMLDTLQVGDKVYGNRLAYLKEEPERGDIIIFHPPDEPEKFYIKRLIGLPGEKVVIDDAKIYINDSEVPLEEDYLYEEWTEDNDDMEYQVPESCYFMLGDNREVSLDSRYWEDPYVTPEDIGEPLDFASVDVSFISLKLVLPVLYRLLKDGGEAVCLIKPQFEAGRELVGKKGVVREESTHVMVVENALSNAKENGFTPIHLTFSPVKGPEGNIEYLMHLKKGGYEAELPAPEEIVRLSHMTLSE